MLAALIALTLAQSACNAPAGTAELLDDVDKRFIVVGEMHGTAETPAAFAAMVCEAASRGPVSVALELPQTLQPQLDAFIAAATDEAAYAMLEGSWFLGPGVTDGRTSQAMLETMQVVRRLKLEGRDLVFHAFQPSGARSQDLPQSFYELDMGHALARAAHDRPDARVLVLVGNIHARKTAIADMPALGLPAAGHLPADQTLALYVALQGGEAWNCRQECGPHPMPERYDASARGIIMGSYGDGAYDGVLALGLSTASPPIKAQPSRSSE